MEIVERHKIVAIIRLDDLSHAAELAEALVAGGIRALEFTMTNPDALKAVHTARQTITESGVAIGVGSVIMPDHVRVAHDVGAQFVVCPVTKLDVIQTCVSLDLPVMPGAYTPSEIQMAWESGASMVKVFPAHQLGPGYIKDVLAPLPHLKLLPTGGLDVHNSRAYLDAGASAVGIGSALINKNALKSNDWTAVADTARAFCDAVIGAS